MPNIRTFFLKKSPESVMCPSPEFMTLRNDGKSPKPDALEGFSTLKICIM